jgi:hypothetical protein
MTDMKFWSIVIVAASLGLGVSAKQARPPAVTLSGELRQWHKITLTMEGPEANETGDPNPFLDYRLTATFVHESGAPAYVVPGYFAADGDAGNTGAAAGNKWRVHFAPDRVGRWQYRIAFVSGRGVAIDAAAAANAAPVAMLDGRTGTLQVLATNKTGADLRARGRLEYVGTRYLRFAGTGDYFLKIGSDSPETLLGYADFDGTRATKPAVPLKTYAPHVADWKAGDPTWQNGKGKGLIGALNYLSSKGVNSISFLPYNAGGDGDNVWPFAGRDDKFHYDVSKLDQWQVVFDHAQTKGLYLHVKLQETENDDNTRGTGVPGGRGGAPGAARGATPPPGGLAAEPPPAGRGGAVPGAGAGPQGAGRGRGAAPTGPVVESLDGGDLGPERKLYLRELIARFGHVLALNWNLGEENTQTPAQQREMAGYIASLDPYDHLIVAHTYPQLQDQVYQPLLAEQSALTGASLQNIWNVSHERTLRWVTASERAGKTWVVASDEQGPADFGTPPDPGYKGYAGRDARGQTVPYGIDDIRKLTLWGTLMAGGAGVEYYFGYQLPENDLVGEDFRSRDRSWDYARHAVQFFTNRTNRIPFWEMRNVNALVGNPTHQNTRYAFAKDGELYLVYLPSGGTADLDLGQAAGIFAVSWFDPRNGGAPRRGSVATVKGGGSVSLGAPPDSPTEDWLAIVRRN